MLRDGRDLSTTHDETGFVDQYGCYPHDSYGEELVMFDLVGSEVVRAISMSWHAREPKPGRKS